MKKYNVQPLDLMQFINTKYHEPFIHERIEFSGKMDEERFSEAVNTLISAFPILKCRYDSEENAFVETDTITGKTLIRTDDIISQSGLLTESLDMSEKLIQFTLSENTLYITVSHLVCDGSGFKQLIYLLCDIYNGSFDGDNGYLMERNFGQLTKSLKRQTGMTIQMLLSMAGNYKNKPIYTKAPKENSHIIEKTIPKEIMQKVHAAAKKQDATLNDVFLAAYARALHKSCKLNKINIPCTVDLRKYTKNKTGIANLTGTYNLNIKIGEGEPFSMTLTAVSASMKKQKKTRNDIAGPMLLVSKYEKSTLESFLKLYGGMNTGAFTDFTNLGVLDDKRLWFNGTTVKNAVGYSGLNKAPCFQIAVSSFKGETTISSLFQCAENEREKADLLMDEIVKEIQFLAKKLIFNIS